MEAGRARLKVENESNNTLKSKCYHLTHNLGHGKQHLATLLVPLNLLAFLMHTVLELMDSGYGLIREKMPTRKAFYQDIQTLTSDISLMNFLIKGLRIELPDTG